MECPGPLIWHDVPATNVDGSDAAGVLECGSCDFITTTGNLLDARHSETMCVRSDA